MGVPPIELQNQGGKEFKYFHLKEEVPTASSSSLTTTTGSVVVADDSTTLLLDSAPPKLSVWGWISSPSSSQQQHYSNRYPISSLEKKSIGFSSHEFILHPDNSSSDSESENQYKIDINIPTSPDVSTSTTTIVGGEVVEIKFESPSLSSSTLEQHQNTSLTSSSLSTNNSNNSKNNNSQNRFSSILYSMINSSTDSINKYRYSTIFSDVTFSILVFVVCVFFIVYSILAGPIKIIGAFIVSIVVLSSYIVVCFSPNNKWYMFSVSVLAVGLGLCIPSFFDATGKVVQGVERELWDRELVVGDNTLMGWLFPLGQMGLFVDQSRFIGPQSFLGRFSTEIFQLSYISYYIWGYFMELYILFNMWRCHRSKDPAVIKMLSLWDQRLKMFVCTWLATYFLVFSVNLTFPAESPRVYLNGKYEHPLTGFGFAGFIRNKIENAAKGSYGSFPSGHIATSWAVAIAAYRVLPIYGTIASVAALLITIATMYLRYHYFVDFLAAIP
eukprot:gene8535-10490_t